MTRPLRLSLAICLVALPMLRHPPDPTPAEHASCAGLRYDVHLGACVDVVVLRSRSADEPPRFVRVVDEDGEELWLGEASVEPEDEGGEGRWRWTP